MEIQVMCWKAEIEPCGSMVEVKIEGLEDPGAVIEQIQREKGAEWILKELNRPDLEAALATKFWRAVGDSSSR